MKTILSFTTILIFFLCACSSVEPIETHEIESTESTKLRSALKLTPDTIVFYPHKGIFENDYLTAEFLPHQYQIQIISRYYLAIDLWSIETVQQNCENTGGAYACNDIYLIDVSEDFVRCMDRIKQEGISLELRWGEW